MKRLNMMQRLEIANYLKNHKTGFINRTHDNNLKLLRNKFPDYPITLNSYKKIYFEMELPAHPCWGPEVVKQKGRIKAQNLLKKKGARQREKEFKIGALVHDLEGMYNQIREIRGEIQWIYHIMDTLKEQIHSINLRVFKDNELKLKKQQTALDAFRKTVGPSTQAHYLKKG